MSIASILGISLGILSAVKQYSVLDHTLVVVALIFASIPGFWLGLMLMLLFSLKLHWLPSYGAGSLKHFILPTLTVHVWVRPRAFKADQVGHAGDGPSGVHPHRKGKGSFTEAHHLEACPS
ncbi:MAG: ABC transporter permease subunit [Lachnospiraceae bacterium]